MSFSQGPGNPRQIQNNEQNMEDNGNMNPSVQPQYNYSGYRMPYYNQNNYYYNMQVPHQNYQYGFYPYYNGAIIPPAITINVTETAPVQNNTYNPMDRLNNQVLNGTFHTRMELEKPRVYTSTQNNSTIRHGASNTSTHYNSSVVHYHQGFVPSSNNNQVRSSLATTPVRPKQNDTKLGTQPKLFSTNESFGKLTPSVVNYVNRCYDTCDNAEKKALMENYLKDMLRKCSTEHRIHLINWDSKLIPKFGVDIPYNNYKPPTNLQQKFKNNTKIAEKAYFKRKNKKKFFQEKNRSDIANKSSVQKMKQKMSETFGDEIDADSKKLFRQNRFKNTFNQAINVSDISADNSLSLSTCAWTPSVPIVGTSTALEKSYLRLTCIPNKEEVRPLNILKESLEFVLQKWRRENNYQYLCEQLKSIRQDLTIQGIRNDFVVEVYENHARIALDCDDMSEFNRCQNVLKELYSEGYEGHKYEFFVYRFLYYMYTNSNLDVANAMKEIYENNYEKQDIVSLVLTFYEHMERKYYKAFFKIYKKLQVNLKPKILEFLINRERLCSFKILVKSHYGIITSTHLMKNMGFSNVSDTQRWLSENLQLYVNLNNKNSFEVDCKECVSKLHEKNIL